jgi:hypothetical protein
MAAVRSSSRNHAPLYSSPAAPPLPLGGVNELSGRLPEPLRYAHSEVHIRDASRPQIGQSAWRATKLLPQLRPRETALATLLVERYIELVQVPAEPAIGSRLRQLDAAHIDDRAG